MRILITGSRDWTDRPCITQAIANAMNDHHASIEDTVIVHGAAAGADRLAEEVAQFMGIKTDPHPVTPEDWDRIGKRAGILRNIQMVKSGADICLAFINPCRKDDCIIRGIHGSHGATHCSETARRAGIRTRFFHQRRGKFA